MSEVYSPGYSQGRWQRHERRATWKRENKLEKELIFTKYLLSTGYFQVELHSTDEETEAPEGKAIWPRSHME